MPPIVTSAEVDRPAAEVLAYVTDPAGFSQWQKAWWTGTWTARQTAPRPRPWARNA